ncbi:uncharacterized protein LOC130663489 isoform X2 [Microplitis mediator]|uniref:uncharacterized protein LOC130663489 isoform X2 n=1 Tax=Microplitis mediator TaxID=375433 RepID=UPI002554C8C0|nr:uncharacterized protein LOC130663489 isoform X2 [Microplitis mediator]
MSFVLQLGSAETLEETSPSIREIASVTIQERTTEPMSIVLQLGTAAATGNSEETHSTEKSTAMMVTKPAIVYPNNQIKVQQNNAKSNIVTTAAANSGGVISAVAKPGTIVYPAKAIKDQKLVGPVTTVESKIIATPLVLTQQQISASTGGALIPCSLAANHSTTPLNPHSSKSVINSTANSNLPGKIQLTYEVMQNKQQQHSSNIIQSTASQKVVGTTTGVKTITSTNSMSNIQRLRTKSPSTGSPNANVHKVKTITSINNQGGMVPKNFTSRVQAVSKAQTSSTNVAITPVAMTQVITNSNIQRLQQQNNQQKIQQNQTSSNQTTVNTRVNTNNKVAAVQQPIDQTQSLQKVAGVFPKTLAVQRQPVATTGTNNVQKVSIAGIQKTTSVPQNQPQINNTVHFQNSQQPKSQITSVQKSQTALVLNNSTKNLPLTNPGNIANIAKSSSVPNVSKIQQNSTVTLGKAQLISQSQLNVHHTLHVQQIVPQTIQGQAVSKQQQQQHQHQQPVTLQTARMTGNTNSQPKLNVIQQNATLTSIPINQKNPLVVNAKVQSQPQMLLKVGPMKNSPIGTQHPGNTVKTVGQKAAAANQMKANPQQVGISMNRTVNAQPIKIIQQHQQQQSPQHIVVNPMTAQKQPGCIKTIPAQKPPLQQQQQQQQQQQRNNTQKVGGIKTSLNTNMNSLKAQMPNNPAVPPNSISQKQNLRTFHSQQLTSSNIMIHKNQTMKIQQQNIQQKQKIITPQYTQQQNVRPQAGQIKTILPVISPDIHKEVEAKVGHESQISKEQEFQEQPTSPVRRMPLPYECLQFVLQDHNYGAPPPRTPPPASPPPHPQQQPLNGASGSTLQHSFMYNQVITNNSTADDAASAISSDAGREVEPEGEETETAPEGEGDDEDSITRCICDFEHDDGYMICCDRCLVWQHVDCMGIDRSNIPDEYLCEVCRPRRVDRQRARTLQLRKREELLNSDTSSDTSSTSSADTDVGSNTTTTKKRPLQQLPVPRRKSDPPPSTLRKLNNNNNTNSNNNNNNNNNNVAKRQRREQLPRQASAGRKKETAKRGPGKRKTKRRISLDGEDETQDAWGSNMAPLRQWIERYEEAVTNHYSPELRARISSIKVNGTHSDLKQSNMSSGASGKCRLNVHSNSLRFLVATVYLPPNTPIIELRGKYMLSTQHRPTHPQGRQHAQRPGPFVFFYRLPREGTEVCVDTRTYGNDARFVRRSCKPNAEIKHCIEKGTLHLYIVTTTVIEKSTEITIRHEQHDLLLSPNSNSTVTSPLPCACGNPRTCQITTAAGQLSSTRRGSNGTLAENADGRERRRRGRRNTVNEESDVSSSTTSTPPVVSQPTPNSTATPTSSTSSTSTVSAGAKKMITNPITPVPVPAVTTAAVAIVATTTTTTIITTITTATATVTTSTTTMTPVVATTPAVVTKVLPKEEASVSVSQPPAQQVLHSTSPVTPTSQETSKKDKKKMTREERKMEAIMKAFERLEKAEQRKQEVQARNAQRKESGGAHSDNDDPPLSLPTKPKQQHIERPLRRKRRKGRARTTSSSHSQSSRRTRLNSADSDMSSGDESIMMQSPPSSCIPNREAPFSPRLHTPTKDENCVAMARDSNNQTIPTAAGLLLALANSNVPGPSSPPLQQPPPSKSPTCDSGASSSSQSSTPSTPLSSACLLVAAAVGPLAPGFKFPKTKKAMMNEWLRDSPDTPHPPHVQLPPHISPNISPMTSVPSPSPVIPSTNRSIDFLSPTDPSPEFLTQSYAAKSLATLVQAANSVSGICDSPPQRKQVVVAQNANGCPVSSGSAKKRWLRQAISEECDSPNSRPESPPSEMVAPPKKRRIARESISSDNYTPPTTPTPVHTEAGPTNSALSSSENDFSEHPQSPLSIEGRIKTDYEADNIKEDTNSDSEKPEFFETIKPKVDLSDSDVKEEDERETDKPAVSDLKDQVELSPTEIKNHVKDEIMEVEDDKDIDTSVNLIKIEEKPSMECEESSDVIKPSSVTDSPIKRETSSPLVDEKCPMEVDNQSEPETDEPRSPIGATESESELKPRAAEMTLEYGTVANVVDKNESSENIEKPAFDKDCQSNDGSSIDEFDVEAQMKMITGDDGNDYKEKVDTCSDKDNKSMDGIEGLMDSSKEDSDSEDHEMEDTQPSEEPRRFKELERDIEERAFKELETMSHNQDFDSNNKEFVADNVDTPLECLVTTKPESSTTTTTTSEESMFDSVSSNIDCESVVEPPKIFQSIPPLSERIRKKPDSSAAPKKSLVFEAAMIESTIDMESVEITENGDDKNQLSTALRELLRSKIDEEPTAFMNAENTDPPLENINPSPEDINPPLESINPSPEDINPPFESINPSPDDIIPSINSSPKDINPSPKEIYSSPKDIINRSPVDMNPSPKDIESSPKHINPPPEDVSLPESINPSSENVNLPLDDLYPSLEKISPQTEHFNSSSENNSPPVLNHIEAIVLEPSVQENSAVLTNKQEIVSPKVEEKAPPPPPPPQPEVRRLKDPRTAVPNRGPSPKHDAPAPVKRKLSISEYRKRKQQSTGTPPEPEPSNDVSSSDKSPARGRSDSASSGTSSLSSDDDNAKTTHDLPGLTTLPLFAGSENEERKGGEEGIIGWSAAPTLVERQRENLTERLKREFGLFLSDDEEERARKQGLTAEAILKARKEAMPNQVIIPGAPTSYPQTQLPPQTYIPPPGSAVIHYPQFQVKPGIPGAYMAVPQPIPPPVPPPPGMYPVSASTATLSSVGKPVPPQFLVPQAPPGSNPYPPQFIPTASPPAPTQRFPVATPPPPPLTLSSGFPATPQPSKPYYIHPPPAPRT